MPASLPQQLAQCFGMPCVDVTSPPNHSKERDIGYYRLVEHLLLHTLQDPNLHRKSYIANSFRGPRSRQCSPF